MIKGHLDQTRKNVRSTRKSALVLPDGTELKVSYDDIEDYYPSLDLDNHRTHYCYAATIEPTGQIYTDQTGKFVHHPATATTIFSSYTITLVTTSLPRP
jgi:hypothetical protein